MKAKHQLRIPQNSNIFHVSNTSYRELNPIWSLPFATEPSHFTSLLSYGSNRPHGLLGLTGDGKSNSTLLLWGKLESEPESDSAAAVAGGCKWEWRWSPSSSSLPAPWASWTWCWFWWWWWLCWWWCCPPWQWGSCIMFSSSESSEWLECWKRRRGSKEGNGNRAKCTLGKRRTEGRKEGDHWRGVGGGRGRDPEGGHWRLSVHLAGQVKTTKLLSVNPLYLGRQSRLPKNQRVGGLNPASC